MRYDSDPYIVKKIVIEADILQASLSQPRLKEIVPPYLFVELEPIVSAFLSTLDHFAQLHTLNPQFSLSRFSAHTLEQKLLAVGAGVLQTFSRKPFRNVDEKALWYRERFLNPLPNVDPEQLFVALHKKLAQLVETYSVNRVRDTHFAALLNQVAGWSEHIEMHGHHDIYAVILFAEKVARDKAVIEYRVEVVREICTVLLERAFLKHAQDGSLKEARNAAFDLSRIYSSYLLELYAALLEDMEIIAVSEQDYHAFEKYCHQNQIEVYEEYHEVIKAHLRRYVEDIAIYVSSACRIVQTANLIINAEMIVDQYREVETAADALGLHLAEAIRVLQRAVHQLKADYPKLAQQYVVTLQKVKKLKGDIVKPAIKVYSQYLQEPGQFLEKLPANQTAWMPIIETAMACLEPDDDLYQKCAELKAQMDQAAPH